MIVLVYLIVLLRQLLVSTIFCMVIPKATSYGTRSKHALQGIYHSTDSSCVSDTYQS